MKINNMGIQLQIVGQLVTTFDVYAINIGESKHILVVFSEPYVVKGPLVGRK